jgi:hypothetical protein
VLVWLRRIGELERGLVLTPRVAGLKAVDIVIKGVIVTLMAVFVAKRDWGQPLPKGLWPYGHSDPLQTRAHSTLSTISLN